MTEETENAEQSLIRQLEDNDVAPPPVAAAVPVTIVAPTSADSESSTTSAETQAALYEAAAANVIETLGLKGGSQRTFRLPPKSFYYKMGLRGGSKDAVVEPGDGSQNNSTDNGEDVDENNVTINEEAAMNGALTEEKMMEVDEIKEEIGETEIEPKFEASALDDSELDGSSYSGSQETASHSYDDGRHDEMDEQDDESVMDQIVKKEDGDALSALASAALDHSKDNIKKTDSANHVVGVTTPNTTTPTAATGVVTTDANALSKEQWHTVGFIKGSSCDVLSYFMLDDCNDLTADNLPDLNGFPRVYLEPGTAYKFRVAAINSVGVGEWSEVSAQSMSLYIYQKN